MDLGFAIGVFEEENEFDSTANPYWRTVREDHREATDQRDSLSYSAILFAISEIRSSLLWRS